MEVNIYVETTIHGPAKGKGAGMYLIEYIKSNGEPETREGVLYLNEATEQQLVLTLVEMALKRLTKSCSCLVLIKAEGILNAQDNGWIEKWAEQGWKKANGKPVQNADIWQQLYEQFQKHEVLFSGGGNSYRPAMEQRMKEEVRKHV